MTTRVKRNLSKLPRAKRRMNKTIKNKQTMGVYIYKTLIAKRFAMSFVLFLFLFIFITGLGKNTFGIWIYICFNITWYFNVGVNSLRQKMDKYLLRFIISVRHY